MVKFYSANFLALFILLIFTIIGSGQEKPAIISNEGVVFYKCFELPQKFLLKGKSASDNDLESATDIKADVSNFSNFFTTSQVDSQVNSNLVGLGNTSEKSVEPDSIFESWNTDGQLNWKINYSSDLEKFIPIGSQIYSIKIIKSEPRIQILVSEVSQSTGLIVWQRQVHAEWPSEPKIENFDLRKFGRLLSLFENESGHIFVFSEEVQDVISKQVGAKIKALSNNSSATVFILDSADQVLRFDVASSKEVSVTKLPYVSHSGLVDLEFSIDEAALYLIDAVGKISKFGLDKTGTEWKYQTGAAVSGLIFSKTRVLAVSLDNFAYYLNQEGGRKVWKKRLPGRSLAKPLFHQGVVVLPIFGDNQAVVLDIKNGKQVGAILLPNGEYFLQSSLIIKDTLIFTVSYGTLIYSRNKSCQKLKG